MRFGLQYQLRNPAQWERPIASLYQRALDQIAWADEAGFDDVVLCEHHFTDDNFLPSLLPFCAAIAARTRKLRIGTNVFLLPLHHPVRVAEDGAVVDIISNGRFELSVGAGLRPEEFAGYGMRLDQRPGRMEEGIEIIKRCWTEEEFSFEGRYYKLKNVRMTPKPVQKPRPAIIMGAASEAASRRAARIADGFRPVGLSFWDYYYDELEKLGRPFRRKRHAQRPTYLFVSDDPNRDWPRILPHARHELQCYAQWGLSNATSYGALALDEENLKRIYLVKTPDEAAELLAGIQAIDPEEIFNVTAMLPGMDPDFAQTSLDLYAEKVIPMVRRHGRG